MAWINNIYNFWGTVLIVIVVIWLWRFWTGLKSRRDQRFRNLGFDGYKDFKQSPEEVKERLYQEYKEGIARGELIGREYDESALNLAKNLTGLSETEKLIKHIGIEEARKLIENEEE